MKRKIAFVSGWYNFIENETISDSNRFVLECLYKTAKKNFMADHEVDFILFTNDESLVIDNVKKIFVDDKVHGFWHMCLMKILSLKYLPDDYDYVFVHDTDQIYVNEVRLEGLDSDFYILEHFWRPTISHIHKGVTDIVPLDFDYSDHKWTMGNFFGGKKETVKKLYEFTQHYHNLYFGQKTFDSDFYTLYPEEIFLIKFVYEKNIEFKILLSTAIPSDEYNNFFLSDFNENVMSDYEVINKKYPNIPKAKLLHNTKKNIDLLRQTYEFYT